MGITSQIVGLAIGWLLIARVCVQALVIAVRASRRRAQWQREFELERADFCRRVEATARAARASKAIAEWTGWRPFRVAAIVDEARDVKSFYFTPVDGRPLLPFAPGQYLTFRLPVGGASAIVRCYSLSDRPRQDYYRVTVKRIGASAVHSQRGQAHLAPRTPHDHRGDGARPVPGGRGSGYLHECVRVGDVLDVRAPAGTFLVDPLAGEPVVLIGAGIGVTPLVSMLEAYVHSGQRRDVYAIFGFRNSGEHPFKEPLTRLAERNPWIQLHTSYSAPLPADVLYRDYNHHGRLTVERLRTVLPSNNFRFYVCGPGEMMESLVPALWEWGVPESHVHFEAFGPASVKSAGGHRSRGARVAPCAVRFERTDRTVTWDGSLASLLEFGEVAGVAMPSGCRAGSCGECMTAIRRGSVTTIKQPGIAVPAGHCLTCISAPVDDLVLDA
jgi:ferredoxin-NADP reductase